MSTKALVLFDVDGTLTKPRLSIEQDMIDTLKEIKEKRKDISLAIVGGSDFVKQQEQLHPLNILSFFDYVFSENGLVAYKGGELIAKQNISTFLGEANLKKFINAVLFELSQIDEEMPIKRGTFIEYRNGMLNISPIGRNCSQKEREEFYELDQQAHIREKLVNKLSKQFEHLQLKFSIGGQISFDVFPVGWDKTYCLRFVESNFGDIHFFGDKTEQGGNDFEIYTHKRVIGHSVKNYTDTVAELKKLFLN